jgi:hypothetical protein
VENYIEDKARQEIIKKIRNLELPNHWEPKQVIDYITYKIDRK